MLRPRDLDREGICERHFPEMVEAASGAGVTGVELVRKASRLSSVRKRRSRAIHFAGSQYSTRGSVRPANARIAG